MNRSNIAISFLMKSSQIERRRMIWILYIIIKSYFFVTYTPSKHYYKKYNFGKSRQNADLQPFNREIGLIRKTGKIFPLQITCLMECMAIQEYLRRYDFITPISLGIKISEGDSLSAHAWISQSSAGNYYNIFN